MIKNVYHRLLKIRQTYSQRLLRKRLTNSDFTIIANDCWGGEVYKRLNLPYTTPFVGLMMMAPCYVTLLENLESYLSSELEFKATSKYEFIEDLKIKKGKNFPIGVLNNDVEIHFLHYPNEQEALEKWNRRVKMINWSNILLKYDANKDFSTDEYLKRFDNLSSKKVSFGITDHRGVKSYVKVREWDLDAVVFFNLMMKDFDFVGWINGQKRELTWFDKIEYYLFHRKF